MFETELEFERAEDYEATIQRLSTEYFDVLILDLMLPSINAPANIKNAEAVLGFLDDDRSFNSPLVIGLTAVDEAFVDQNRNFSDRLLMLEKYHPLENGWARNISEKLVGLTRSRSAFLSFLARNKGIDLVILAARYKSEFLPIVSLVQWSVAHPVEEKGPSGTTVVRGTASIGGKEMSVMIVSMGQMGLSSTSAITTILIERYRPRYLAMLGMCCGFRIETASSQSKLLDVSIAKTALCWDEGKYYDEATSRGLEGFSYRADPTYMANTDSLLVSRFIEEGCLNFNERAKKLLKQAKIQTQLKPLKNMCSDNPKVSFGLNVSGNCIVSRRSLIDQIVGRNPTAQSLEMEIYSVMKAVSLTDGLRPVTLCIKAVADFGEEKESDLFDPVQPIASKISFLAFDELMFEMNNRDSG